MGCNKLCLYLIIILTIVSIHGVLLQELLDPTSTQYPTLNGLCPGPSPPISSNNIPAEPSLRYVFGIFRHGIRYPLGPTSLWTNDISRPSIGKLTKIGKQQLYYAGKELRKRYREFLNEYDEDKVSITSTPVKRNVMSALSLMAGLFPPLERIFPDLRWQPIPVDTNTADFDKSFLYGKDTLRNLREKCPSLNEYVMPVWDINFVPDPRPHLKLLYEHLQRYTGDITINSIDSIIVYTDIIHNGCLNGIEPPAWLLDPRPEYKNKTIYPDLIKPIAQEWYKNIQYHNNNFEMLNYIVGPLINKIKISFEQVLKKNALTKMSFHVSHDSIINPLLWFLNTTEAISMEPGDGVLFELHVVDNSTYIKIFHYDAINGHVISELNQLACPPPCSYEMFTDRFTGLTPKQWTEKCKLKK